MIKEIVSWCCETILWVVAISTEGFPWTATAAVKTYPGKLGVLPHSQEFTGLCILGHALSEVVKLSQQEISLSFQNQIFREEISFWFSWGWKKKKRAPSPRMAAKGDAPLQVRAADSSTNFLMEHSNQEQPLTELQDSHSGNQNSRRRHRCVEKQNRNLSINQSDFSKLLGKISFSLCFGVLI